MIDILITLGLFFLAVGSIGLVRLPNVFNRMHATSKATTLGAGLITLAAALKFHPEDIWLTTVVVIVFLFITAPTGAHLIARAADRNGEV